MPLRAARRRRLPGLIQAVPANHVHDQRLLNTPTRRFIIFFASSLTALPLSSQPGRDRVLSRAIQATCQHIRLREHKHASLEPAASALHRLHARMCTSAHLTVGDWRTKREQDAGQALTCNTKASFIPKNADSREGCRLNACWESY